MALLVDKAKGRDFHVEAVSISCIYFFIDTQAAFFILYPSKRNFLSIINSISIQWRKLHA